MTGIPVRRDMSRSRPLTFSWSSRPLGCSSRKKFPLPKMSWNSRAVVSAASIPWRIRVWATSPLGLVQAVRGHVGLAAEDGLDPVLLRLLVEVEGAEQVAVIGHRHLLHP